MSSPAYADYIARSMQTTDINEHLPALYALAFKCNTIVEFGTRSGHSTAALLAGLDNTVGTALHSYDIAPQQFTPAALDLVTWHFTQADTSDLYAIPECDLLFIDTLHTCDQVRAELRCARYVRRWIAFHDTVLFGWRDEHPGHGPGIMQAILEFLAEHPQWRVLSHNPANNGLLVLEHQ